MGEWGTPSHRRNLGGAPLSYSSTKLISGIGAISSAGPRLDLYSPTANANSFSGVIILALGGGRYTVLMPSRSKPIRRD